MNTRALALGAMIGFVVAIAPSCSPAKCGPVNCDGCCDASGACVKKPNNGNNSSCGSAGNTCIDCMAANSTCNPTTNTCATTGTGGGTGGGSGGGGGSTCDGCRIPSGTCVPLSTTSTTNCGSNGDRCQACPIGQLCTNGACVIPPPVVGVGSACEQDSDCTPTLGSLATCRKATAQDSGTYVGGYCTIDNCGAAPRNCPTGSTCVSFPDSFGETSICLDNCTGASQCRGAGYQCIMNWCFLDPFPALSSPPADKIGQACTADSQCINPPTFGGRCFTNDLNTRWQDGYCSRVDCDGDNDCSADGGAICLVTEFGPMGQVAATACFADCLPDADGGQGSCRGGYVCEPTTLNDGGTTGRGVCNGIPIPVLTTVGAACMGDVDCQQPAGAEGLCIPGAEVDGGPTGFTDGYCVRADCESAEDCSQDGGATCIVFGSGAQQTFLCQQSCRDSSAGQSNCRGGYVCLGLGQADGGMTADGICRPACNAPGWGCGTGQTCNATTGYCQ